MKQKSKKINLTALTCIISCLIVFIFFSHTIFYQIKAYDEIVPLQESYLPICSSFSEMFELISLLGLNNCFEATNTLYSNIISFRCNPIFNNLFMLLILFFLKKNPVSYHLYSLSLHLINTILIFLILNTVSKLFLKDEVNKSIKLILISTLTLLWALHPVNMESVLLLSNGNIVLSHTLCFLTAFIYLKLQPQDFKLVRFTFSRFIFLFVPFVIALFTAEFNFMLPLILMAYTLVMKIHFNHKSISFSKSFPICFKETILEALPLLTASLIFVISFLFSRTRINIGTFSPILITERILWLSPQIIFHFIKLIFFPINLSIDQTFFVKIAKTLFDPSAIFCIGFIFISILLSLISLVRANKKFPSFFVITIPLLLSLIPYSQVLAQSYNLASERYLYFSSFILIFGFAHLIFLRISEYENKKAFTNLMISILIILLAISSGRAYVRTLDWKNNDTLYKSVIKTTDNPLYKAFKYKELIPQDKILSDSPLDEVKPEYKKLAIKYAKQAITELQKQTDMYEVVTPIILKTYGLDPETLLSKAAYVYAQTSFRLNKDPKIALKIMQEHIKDLSILPVDALVFYSTLFYQNNMLPESEEILKILHERDPYSLRIIFITADLTKIDKAYLKEIEKFALQAFKYFPYDIRTLTLLKKIYQAKGDYEKFADFSYIYGLRAHSAEDLKVAQNIYFLLNKKDKALRAENRISSLEKTRTKGF